MPIFKGKIGNGMAGGIAGDDDGEFAKERDMLLEDRPGNVDFWPNLGGVGRGIEGELALAVITKSGGFEAGFSGKCFHRCGEI